MNKSFFDIKSSKIGIDLARLASSFSGVRLQSSALSTNGNLIQEGAGVDALLIEGDLIRVNFIADESVSDLLDDLKSLGIQGESIFNRVISGWLSFDKLAELENLNSLRFARPVYKSITTNVAQVKSDDKAIVAEIGFLTSQGDKAQRSDKARERFGIDGSNVKVGVLSDSFNVLGGYADDIASGDLPRGVEVLKEFTDGTDEGRAMLQIIHDIAPGAALAFRTTRFGDVDYAKGIKELARAGARVIIDDVLDITEPFFQDGIIAQAVNKVTKSGRVSYFSSAGNYFAQSYQSEYRPSTVIGSYQLHDFDPGPNVDIFQDVSLLSGESFKPVFQWDEPFASASTTGAGAENDLDIFIFSEPTFNFDFLVARSAESNVGGDALESITFEAPRDDTYYVVLGKYLPKGGPNPSLVKYIDFSPFTLEKSSRQLAEYFGASTVFAQANSEGGLAVGAAAYFNTPEFGVNPPQPNYFTSLGGTPILFDTSGERLPEPIFRAQPGITAPDTVSTTVPNFNPFTGTSASAPSAAAAAALLLDAVPNATNRDIYRALKRTAIDMVVEGFDRLTGAGLIQVDAAVRELLSDDLKPERNRRLSSSSKTKSTSRRGFLSWPGSDLLAPQGIPIPISTAIDQAMNNYSYSSMNGFSAVLSDQIGQSSFGPSSSSML